ncbi:DUF1801 domain-containing protein [Candidatus Dojkabacteria bacterium]|nr:DUF1801 domain-containing protein [Candidatus Dojkabacteria bacterium]
MDKQKVEEYIKKQKKSHQEILRKLRKLTFETFPGIKDGFEWGVPVYDGGRFYLAALKKQVNFGFSIVGLNEKEIAQFEGSGETARHIKVKSYTKDLEKRLVTLMKLVKKKAGIPS